MRNSLCRTTAQDRLSDLIIYVSLQANEKSDLQKIGDHFWNHNLHTRLCYNYINWSKKPNYQCPTGHFSDGSSLPKNVRQNVVLLFVLFQLQNLMATIFGIKHDINNRARALCINYKGSHTPSQKFMNFGPQTA